MKLTKKDSLAIVGYSALVSLTTIASVISFSHFNDKFEGHYNKTVSISSLVSNVVAVIFSARKIAKILDNSQLEDQNMQQNKNDIEFSTCVNKNLAFQHSSLGQER